MAIMADLAAVFHWQPGEMRDLSVEDLVEFREHAKARSRSAG